MSSYLSLRRPTEVSWMIQLYGPKVPADSKWPLLFPSSIGLCLSILSFIYGYCEVGTVPGYGSTSRDEADHDGGGGGCSQHNRRGPAQRRSASTRVPLEAQYPQVFGTWLGTHTCISAHLVGDFSSYSRK